MGNILNVKVNSLRIYRVDVLSYYFDESYEVMLSPTKKRRKSKSKYNIELKF